MTVLRLTPPLPEPGRFPRQPSQPVEYDDATGEFILTFDPDLTAQEMNALNDAISLARSPIQVTPEEWAVLRPRIQSSIAHRDRTNAQWTALTAAQRDQALIDWNRDLHDVLRALLRE